MPTVNQKTCIGCGACASICEEVFEMKDGKSHVKKGKVNFSLCKRSNRRMSSKCNKVNKH
jgi:ferredoxin